MAAGRVARSRDGDVLLAKRNADSLIGTDLDEQLRARDGCRP